MFAVGHGVVGISNECRKVTVTSSSGALMSLPKQSSALMHLDLVDCLNCSSGSKVAIKKFCNLEDAVGYINDRYV